MGPAKTGKTPRLVVITLTYYVIYSVTVVALVVPWLADVSGISYRALWVGICLSLASLLESLWHRIRQAKARNLS